MIKMLATSWGLYGHCSCLYGIASPRSSLAPWGCFVGTHTIGVYVWWSTRSLRLIVFTTFTKWSRPPHRGERLGGGAWERQHEKLWPSYDMKWMSEWSIRSTATSQAKPKKERKMCCCLLEIMTTLGASLIKWSWLMLWFEIRMKLSRKSSY
jgi:hypothetical protein